MIHSTLSFGISFKLDIGTVTICYAIRTSREVGPERDFDISKGFLVIVWNIFFDTGQFSITSAINFGTIDLESIHGDPVSQGCFQFSCKFNPGLSVVLTS